MADDSKEHRTETNDRGFVVELRAFLGQNKKWWLLPFVITMILLAALVILGGTDVAPFMYTLF